jgi:hypothetical protein
LRCLGLRCLGLRGERLNPSVELSAAESVSAVSETGTAGRLHTTDWAARDEARHEGSGQGGGQGRGQSRAPARNVTSTWGLGARLWRRPITRSVVCRAALILVARPPPARRSPPARHSWLMAGLVWSLADASCVAVANNGFSAQLFLEPGVQVTRLTPVACSPNATTHRPPSAVLPIAHTCPAIRPAPTLSTNIPMAVAVAVAVAVTLAVSIPHPSIRCLAGPGPGPDHDPRAILGAERNRPRLPLPTPPLPTLPPPTLPPR